MKHAPINRKVLGDSLQCHFSEEPCIGVQLLGNTIEIRISPREALQWPV